MTLQGEDMAAAGAESTAAAPERLARTRPFYWSVRREIWENRSIYMAPLIAASVVLLGFLISMMAASHVRITQNGHVTHPSMAAQPYDFAAIAIMLTMLIVAVFYSLGALHGERRDRTILFWKSLPVSDLTTVAAKASIPLVVLPLVAFTVIIATQLVILVLSAAASLAHGGAGPSPPLAQMAIVLLYGLVTLSLWWAPIYGWLMLVSSWAKRAPFLWAVLPPLALCLLEQIALQTSRFADLLRYRLGGSFSEAFVDGAFSHTGPGRPAAPLSLPDPGKFLAAPGLWLGLVFAAACFAAAIWMRRRRELV